jgi:hypothetical protein
VRTCEKPGQYYYYPQLRATMDVWKEIERIDEQIIGNKRELRDLMQTRRNIHNGLCTSGGVAEDLEGLDALEEKPKNIVEKIAEAESIVDKMGPPEAEENVDVHEPEGIVAKAIKEKFVIPSQEEIASIRKKYDADRTW